MIRRIRKAIWSYQDWRRGRTLPAVYREAREEIAKAQAGHRATKPFYDSLFRTTTESLRKEVGRHG